MWFERKAERGADTSTFINHLKLQTCYSVKETKMPTDSLGFSFRIVTRLRAGYARNREFDFRQGKLLCTASRPDVRPRLPPNDIKGYFAGSKVTGA